MDAIPQFILIDSGKAVESTKEMVEQVAKNQQHQHILKHIGSITEQIESGLKKQSFDITLIGENEKLLEDIGVVGEKAQSIIRKIREVGGYAKIAGAGGIRDGSGVILAFHQNIQILEECCKINQFRKINIRDEINHG